MKKVNYLFLCVMVMSLSFFSCQKNGDSAKSHLTVKLTDAPGPYNAVYVDVQGVEVTGTNNSAVMLDVKAGIYNLLDLTNGKDTLIGSGALAAGSVEQIRIILGPNNSVMVNNVSYPLSTPSAEQSGLKLQVHKTLVEGVQYDMLLDFDAAQSIVLTGNGTYKLKPVIRAIETAVSGSIKGKISPIGALDIVTATSALATYSTVVNVNGDFMLKGLPAGTYVVTVTPLLPTLQVVKTNVTVTVGVLTDIGTVVM